MPRGQYTVSGQGYYEVVVRAGDRAGNETVSSIAFEIIPKKNVVEKVIEPIKKLFVSEPEEAMTEESSEDIKSTHAKRVKKGSRGIAAAGAAGCGMCAIAGVWIVRRRRIGR